MKKTTVQFFILGAALLVSAAAFADTPDITGRISNIDYTKSVIEVRNELTNKFGNREYRVSVKQGMINDYKKNDRLNIWLDPDELSKAEMIERVSR